MFVCWSIAGAASAGRLSLAEAVAFAQAAVGASMIAFGGLSWVLDGSAAPVAAVLRLEPAMARAGALAPGSRSATGHPSRDIRFRALTFAYPGGSPVLERFDLTVPAGSSLAIVGQNGAGKTTLASLCRFYVAAGATGSTASICANDDSSAGGRRGAFQTSAASNGR